MTQPKLAFAVPGKITNLTGGTIYDRRVIDELRKAGVEVIHIELPGGFPNPSDAEMADALAALGSVPQDVPLIVDGLAFGALEGVETITAPLYPLVHHPLAEESGLADDLRHHLFQTERRNLGYASHIIVPSPHTKTLLTNSYDIAAGDITVARPGTDRPSLATAPVFPPLILAVGIQLPRKGHDVLLQALGQITDLDWTATIVGKALDAQYARKLIKLRAAYGLDDRVTLAGEVGRIALEKLYAKATLFALASRYEGYGIVFDEALVRGLPIVASGAGAVPDTVPQEAGLVVPPDDPQAFADGLRLMLGAPEVMRAKAKAARCAGQALPSWAQTAAMIAATFKIRDFHASRYD